MIREDDKVVVRFSNTGSAPILKQQKFKLPASSKMHTVTEKLRTQLGLPKDESLVRRRPLHRRSSRLTDGPTGTASTGSSSTATSRSPRHPMSRSLQVGTCTA